MPEEEYDVKLIAETGEIINAVFVYDDYKEPCALAVRFAGVEITASEYDFFKALCTIRRQLEPLGLRPRCYGASRNVFPSPMSCDMGVGLKAYKLRSGFPTEMKDLVFIFDSGPDVEPVSVAEQEAYYKVWLESLG
jgi:hypothetical protein